MEVPGAVVVAEDTRGAGRDGVDFRMQVSACSTAAGDTAAYLLGDFWCPEASDACPGTDAATSRVVYRSEVEEAIKEVVTDAKCSVTVADPRDPDTRLLAASEHFACLTGYHRNEIIGKNCRFLNYGCNNCPDDLMRLRAAIKTGAGCVTVLANRRKSGELFLNLLCICGLTVAQNPTTGDKLWFLVGLQADVTNISEFGEIQHKHIAEMQRIACRIRAKLTEKLSAAAVSGVHGTDLAVSGRQARRAWRLLPMPKWPADDWLPRNSKLTSCLAAWSGGDCPAEREASGGGCLQRRMDAPPQHLFFSLGLLGGVCLMGMLWRQMVQCRDHESGVDLSQGAVATRLIKHMEFGGSNRAPRDQVYSF